MKGLQHFASSFLPRQGSARCAVHERVDIACKEQHCNVRGCLDPKLCVIISLADNKPQSPISQSCCLQVCRATRRTGTCAHLDENMTRFQMA